MTICSLLKSVFNTRGRCHTHNTSTIVRCECRPTRHRACRWWSFGGKSAMPASGIINLKDVPDSVIRGLQEEARDSIDHHSLSFVREQTAYGSGTFVHAFGVFGILTAAHVAENLFDRSEKPVGIVITKEPAATFLNRNQVEIVPLGRPSPSADFTELGPDLAFVRILDPGTLSTIKAKKSFVPLERGVLQGYEQAYSAELHPSPWIISGAPA